MERKAEDKTLRLAFRLIEKFHPEPDHTSILAALALRVPTSLVGVDFWGSTEVRDVLDKTDAQIVDKHELAMAECEDNQEDFTEIHAEVTAGGEAAAKKLKQKPAEPGEGTHRGPIKDIEPGILTREWAEAHAPFGWKVFKSLKDNRWRISHATLPPRSRSWREHGFIGSLGLCLQHAWQYHERIYKLSCPYPWVTEAKEHTGP